MNKKKVVAVAVAAIMAASAVGVLAGCGNSGGKDAKINILLLANDTEDRFYRQYFKDMEQEFADEGLDVKITYNGYEESDYYQNLSDDFTKGDIPDIFYIRPNEILQYKDQIANLQEYANTQTDVDLSTIYDTALNMYRYNDTTNELGTPSGDLYAFPKDLSTQQLGYNKTLLERVAPQVRTETGLKMPYDDKFEGYTWDEFKTLCKSIKAADAALGGGNYVCDVPPLEILAKSFSDDKSSNTSPLIDMSDGRANAKIGSFEEGSAIRKAIQYQAELVDLGIAAYGEGKATYANMTAGRVYFYCAMGSWEVADYNSHLKEDLGEDWDVMPWPTAEKGGTWQGLITSAGYVVSKNCVNAKTTDADGKEVPSKKGDIAKRIAISFMSKKTQDKLVKGQISLPLIKTKAEDYTNPANNEEYSPAHRGVYMQVISGTNGFFPAEYYTYNTDWLTPLTETEDKALEAIWLSSNAVQLAASTDWAKVRTQMQGRYDNAIKNK